MNPLVRRGGMPLLVATVALVPPHAHAQTQLRAHVFASGGVSTGATARVYSAIGQPIAGRSASATNGLCSGFESDVARLLGGTFTAVLFASFEARVTGHAVALDWSILAADGLQGYRVYRAHAPGGAWMRIDGDSLAAVPNGRFVDTDIRPGQRYVYRIGAVDRDGEFLSPPRTVSIPAWQTELHPNVPNPFNPATTIPFYLAHDGPVRLDVYDVGGRRVATLVDGPLTVGTHAVRWNGIGSGGAPVGSGVYFVRLRTRDVVRVRKIVLLK